MELEHHGFAPSFSIYSSNSITSRAVARVVQEEEAARFNKSEDFEFTLVLTDELKSPRSGTKCKKTSSARTGSKRWIFQYLLGWSNYEGKEVKKVDNPKQKQNAHERFYMRKRAESELVKRRSYLPYRKNLVGLFANVKGMERMLRF